MRVDRSFSFAFRCPQAFKKLALGGLFTFLFFTVFFAFVVVGFLARLLCDVLEGRDAKLPQWSDFRALFAEGLQPGLIMLAYVSPLVILTIVEMLFGVFSDFASIRVFLPLQVVLFLTVSVILPLALMRCVILGSMSFAFDFRKMAAFLKTNPKTYFKAWGAAFAVNLAAAVLFAVFSSLIATFFLNSNKTPAYALGSVAALIIGSLLCFLSNVITVHLFAQAYRSSKPFEDDDEGEMRASMSLPPPLAEQVQK